MSLLSADTSPYHVLIGLVQSRERALQQISELERRPGIPSLKDIERRNLESTLTTTEKNIVDMLDSASQVPPVFASLEADVARMNGEVPFENSVFLMTKYPENPGNQGRDAQLESVITAVEEALAPYGLIVRRADLRDYSSTSQLWDNVRIHMLGCKYGVAILESKYADEFNPNVALEYGFMSALGREVVFLVESTFRHIRADIVGTLGKRFSWSSDAASVRHSVANAVDAWMRDVGRVRIR